MDDHLTVRCLAPDSVVPVRGSARAAGLDLSASHEGVVPPRGHVAVGTGVAVSIPGGHYGQVASRSGLGRKGILAMHGVIDEDYRGEVRVVLFNHTDEPFAFEQGARIAQLLILPVWQGAIVCADNLDVTVRNTDGFGSTGV